MARMTTERARWVLRSTHAAMRRQQPATYTLDFCRCVEQRLATDPTYRRAHDYLAKRQRSAAVWLVPSPA
jgi:hypothetical protein